MAQRDRHLGSTRTQVQSPARHGGLRIQHCCKRLGSDSCPRNSVCRRAAKKKKKKNGITWCQYKDSVTLSLLQRNMLIKILSRGQAMLPMVHHEFISLGNRSMAINRGFVKTLPLYSPRWSGKYCLYVTEWQGIQEEKELLHQAEKHGSRI